MKVAQMSFALLSLIALLALSGCASAGGSFSSGHEGEIRQDRAPDPLPTSTGDR